MEYELKVALDVPLGALLGVPRSSILAIRGQRIRDAADLKRRFLDVIDNPPGRLDFATGTANIKSHEFYFIDRIHVDRLARKMTELMMDGLPGLAPCGTAMYPTDPEYTTLTADKVYTIDLDCKDDRTHKLHEFVREVELVAADADKVEKRRVPPATCAEMRTLFTNWSLVSSKRIIDLRYVDWTPASQ
jgi:hypothetical protein